MRIEGTPIEKINGVSNIKRTQKVEKEKISSGSDHATMSDKAQLAKTLVEKAKEIPEIKDTVRLQQLAKEIADGSFSIDANKIASRILDNN